MIDIAYLLRGRYEAIPRIQVLPDAQNQRINVGEVMQIDYWGVRSPVAALAPLSLLSALFRALLRRDHESGSVQHGFRMGTNVIGLSNSPFQGPVGEVAAMAHQIRTGLRRRMGTTLIKAIIGQLLSVSCGVVIALGAVPTVSAAADASASTADQGTEIEEVIITAYKRPENLHDVPASVEVVSATELNDTNVNSTLDLSRLVPGLAVDSSKSLFTTIFLRGIGTISNGYSVEPSVGTVVDGVVQARAGSSVYSDFDDIDHIEVLRGPQGTLFGKNSSAGVINIVTKDPTEDPTANVDVGYGSYHEVKFDGAASGALIDNTLLARVSFVADDHGGYIHNIFNNENVDDTDQAGVRAKLLFTPQEGTQILLNADFWEQTGTCCVEVVRAITPGSDLAERGLVPEFTGFPPGFISPTNSQIDANGAGQTDNKSKGISLKWDQAIGAYTLTSITAYRTWNAFSNDALLVTDTPVVSAPYFDATITQHQTSEELRVASPKGGLVDYVAGLFFISDSITDHEHWLLDQAPQSGVPPGTVLLPVNYQNVTGTTNYAAFGEANIHVTDKVTFIAGARETHEKVDFTLAGSLFGVIPVGAVDSDSVNNLSWRLGVRWEINADNMTYATVSRGFKGPAFNGNSFVLGNAQKANPEVSTSYEIGWKADFADKRIRTNLALFFTNLDDFQVQSAFIEDGVGVQLLTNAGQLRSEGVEFGLDSNPMKNLSLNFNSAYIDARYTNFPNAPCWTGQTAAQGCYPLDGTTAQNLDGVASADTPRWSFDPNANYDITLPLESFDAFVRADYSWKSKVQWSPINDPTTIEGSYGVLGAGIGIRGKNKHFEVTVFGRNLTNKYHVNQLLGLPTPAAILSPDYQRIWGASLRYRY
jgi:iron complex outermembrane receptor protein